MQIVFRVDSSLEIGTGHVMRCLTLAQALKKKGTTCLFVCKRLPGNAIELIQQQGFEVLPINDDLDKRPSSAKRFDQETFTPEATPYRHWLGNTQEQDFCIFSLTIKHLSPTWIIIDHYALDKTWEEAAKELCERVMVIDDLANREHTCDLLLDQTYSRQPSDYNGKTPTHCKILLGTDYALLRDEFRELRAQSLSWRKIDTQQQTHVKQVQIFLGGADKSNITALALTKLESINLPCEFEFKIEVVIGNAYPYERALKQLIKASALDITLFKNISNMAERMTVCDIVIGAAGSASWERCCLGVPSLLFTVAENQQEISKKLKACGAIIAVTEETFINEFINLMHSHGKRKEVSRAAAVICDGLGCDRVVGEILARSTPTDIA